MTANRSALTQSKRWIVKVGTSLLTDVDNGLDQGAVDSWVDQIAALRQQGMEFVMVSSGSIGEGVRRLGWQQRPRELHQLQAAAAVGQMGLVQCYETSFKRYNIVTAQVLLTHADLANRERYLNARNTLRALTKLGVVPIVNENDTVVNDEIRFGDNDNLAALVCNLVEAETLVILTDQSGLFDSDPRKNAEAKQILYGAADDASLMQLAGPAGELGSGGMVTKLQAAKKAARSNAATMIVSGHEANVLCRLRNGEEIGSLLTPGSGRLPAKKQWLAGQLRTSGQLVLDDGAVRVLRDAGRSLLPVGVREISGTFGRGDIVVCVDQQRNEIARGLVNYNADETRKIMGRPSSEIESILGYAVELELIHRDNIAVTM